MYLFKQKIINIFGKPGQKWLDKLPSLVNDLASQWELTGLEVIDPLSFNYVLTGYQNTQPIVLKIGLNYDAIIKEAEALRAYRSFGGVGVLESDPKKGALLLEKISPGTSLNSIYPVPCTQALIIMCKMMENLHHAPIANHKDFYSIQDWLSGLDKDGPLPQNYLHKARKLKKRLFENLGKPVLLHGDLHCHNVLSTGTQWVAIDPKGIVGESNSDIWSFIREPISEIPPVAKILNQDQNRIRDWSFVHAVSAAKWLTENNLDVDKLLEFICKLDQM